MRTLFLSLLAVSMLAISCQKEASIDDLDNSGNPTGNGPGVNGACNKVVSKLKKIQSNTDSEYYRELTWNTDGTVKSIKINETFSHNRTINFTYAGGRIVEGELRFNSDNSVYDTVVFRYNSDGLVDSMYLKNDNYFDIRLSYSNKKLVKYERLAGGGVMFYLDFKTDANGNITECTEFWDDNGTFKKQSTHSYTRDDRKNPFDGMAPYMLYLDDGYAISRVWGPNNNIDQTFEDNTGQIAGKVVSGYKYQYDKNCYPASTQNTIAGIVLFPDMKDIYTYY